MFNQFSRRHIGITDADLPKMLETIGVSSVDELIDQAIPANIRLPKLMDLPEAMTEQEFLNHVHDLAQKNKIADNYIGLGYYGSITPSVIMRNVFENPVWYTSYTPYQAEISQGRLEALLNYQTMVANLTALPLANCSLLDEGTSAAEAMTMMFALRPRSMAKEGVNTIFVDKNIFPHTLDVLYTRATPQGINILVGDFTSFDFSTPIYAAIVQYPANDGSICDYREFTTKCHEVGAQIAVAADLMSLALLTPPGEWGADVAFGTTQRMGMPLFYGGPAAGYFATKMDNKRHIPGRIVGISKDINDKKALRLALQSREQHIKREKSLSNICTAQALCAIMAGFYAAYHGNEGIKDIATNIHVKAMLLADELEKMGCKQLNKFFFDTIRIQLPEGISATELRELAENCLVNFRYFEDGIIGISTDELTSYEGIVKILSIFAEILDIDLELDEKELEGMRLPMELMRESKALDHEIFEKYHSETEMMRYIKYLDRKDISLTQSMISLGSCTMKLNAASEMLPLSWPEFYNVHPFAPADQVEGYRELIKELEERLAIITGFNAVSLQATSGASGEYAAMRTIRRYHEATGQGNRNIVLIPSSAHGTNPATATQAGFNIVITACDENGNVDVADIKAKAELHKDNLAALMITYPSTHGIFEPEIKHICDIIHKNGGQVFMDGANMNGQVGLTSPGFIGADACHLNLHKTFASPHGGGGPGVGPIGVAAHLVEYLPSHSFINPENPNKAVSSAPWGSAGIAPITYGYLCMMGPDGLTDATKYAILSANYIAKRVENTFGVVYTGVTGRVGHEMILDCRQLPKLAGINESDIAKRMMDFGYHAPTLSFPVHGTLMIEPTESESLAEIDRFLEMFENIWQDIQDIANGIADPIDNVLLNAPHADYMIVNDEWNHAYGREKAAFPLPWVKENKFWFSVGRVDNGWGDRNLFCTC